MNNIQEVKINEYRNNLKNLIENLDSVNKCFIYSGEFNTDDFNNIKLDLNINKSTCFIDVIGGNFIQNPAVKGLDLNLNIVVYIVAKNDYTNIENELRSQSETCITTMNEIISNTYENKFNLDVIGYPTFNSFRQIMSGDRNKTRFSVFAFDFTQRINFYKKNK